MEANEQDKHNVEQIQMAMWSSDSNGPIEWNEWNDSK